MSTTDQSTDVRDATDRMARPCYSGSTDPLPSYTFTRNATGNLTALRANHMPAAS